VYVGDHVGVVVCWSLSDQLTERLGEQAVSCVHEAGALADDLGDGAQGIPDDATGAVGRVDDLWGEGRIGVDGGLQLTDAPLRRDERYLVDAGVLKLLEHVADDWAVGDVLKWRGD